MKRSHSAASGRLVSWGLCWSLRLAIGLVGLAGGSAWGEVSGTLMPVSVGSGSAEPLVLHLTGVEPGAAAMVERFVDANGDGLVDADDFRVEAFVVTDGQAAGIGGVRNPQIPGDEDAAVDGQMSIPLSPASGPEMGRLAGRQIIRVSSPAAASAAFTLTLTVAQPSQAQSITGLVTDGAHALPYASVVLFEATARAGFALGVIADADGQFMVSAPAGAYAIAAFKPGYVTPFDTAPRVALPAGGVVWQDLRLAPATTSISGTIADDEGQKAGGVQIFAWSQDGLAAISSSRLDGTYSMPVTAGQWQVQTSPLSLRHLGYLSLSGDTDAAVNTSAGAAIEVNIRLPKVTALIHGTVADAGANPLSGIRLGASDSRHVYSSDATTDANGRYVLGVATGLWDIRISAGSPSLSGYELPGSRSVTLTDGQALRTDFFLRPAPAGTLDPTTTMATAAGLMEGGSSSAPATATASGYQISAVNGAHVSGAAGGSVLAIPSRVLAWGDNFTHQCDVPAGLSNAVAVSAGNDHSLALKGDGTVVAWGDNSATQATVPAGLSGVTAIVAGGTHSVALKSDGTVVAWGNNGNGQCTVPGGLNHVIAIGAGEAHTVAVKDDGTVVAWGYNNAGQTTIPGGLSDVKTIAAGGLHTVAVKNDGTVVAWGNSLSGQTTVPGGLSGVTAVDAGYGNCVALKGDGTMAAWGLNYSGQSTVPSGLSGLAAVGAGYFHTVALKTNGTVVVWGGNDYGQTDVPAGLSGVTGIAAGHYHTLAIIGSGQTAATTLAATNVGSKSVTLNGSVNLTNSPSTTLSFDYGPTTTYGANAAAGSGPLSWTTNANASAAVTGLTPSTTYHFRFKGVNSAGTATGADLTFTTASDVATLSGLVLSTGALTPAFSSTITGYTQTVPNATTTLTVKPTAASASSVLLLNSQAITSGTTSGSIALNPGLNVITILVTAEDGTTTKSYTVNITRLAPPLAVTGSAANVTVTGAKLNGTLNALNSSTAASFEYGTTTAYGSSAAATPSPVTGSTATAVSATLANLVQGTTYYYRVKGVSAGGTGAGAGGSFTTTSNVAALSGLVLSSGALKPAFAPATTAYTQTLPASVTSLSLTPTAASPLATLTLNGAPFTSGTTSGAFTLAPGLNTFVVAVTAQDGLTKRTYTVNVTQMAAPDVTTLPATNLTAVGARLNGTVNALNTSTAVHFEYGQITSHDHTIAAVPAAVTGTASAPVSAALSGLTPKTTYYFHVAGASAGGAATGADASFTTPNNVAALSAIGLGSGTLNPVFKSTTTSYAASVENAVTSIFVTPTPVDPNATVTVNGLAAAPGATIDLIVGINTITIVGKAEDGLTTKAYTLKVTRAPAKASLTTLAASNIGATSATLNGEVNTANSTTTAISFEYGLTTNYGSKITGSPAAVGGTARTPVSARPTGLKPSTTYHYRIKGMNAAGASTGGDLTFRTPSNVATLASLVMSSGALKPAFASSTTSYTQTVPATTTSLTITPTATSAAALLDLNGDPILSGATSGAFTLAPGLNTFVVTVMAEDAATFKNYTVNVTQLAAPVVTTVAASNVGALGATLNGTVNALNSSTKVTFDFGQTTGYGISIAAKPSPLTNNTTTAVAGAIGNLLPNTSYHYRVRAVSAGGTTLGDDIAFTTRSLPPVLVLNALQHARVGDLYGQQVGVASGGVPPYAFTIGTGGGFPPIGIHMDASGYLAGTPSIEGTYIFDVTVTDITGSSVTRTTTLIVDPPGLSIADVSATEGNTGTKDFVFTVTLSAKSSRTVTVKYATANGTASAPSDYTAIPATLLSFAPGETTQTITVHVNGDTTVESNETFFVNLTTPVNAGLVIKQGIGTILNDDAPAGSATISASPDAVTMTAPVCFLTPCDISQTVTVTSSTPWTLGGELQSGFTISPQSGPAGSTEVTVTYTSFGVSTPPSSPELLTVGGYLRFRTTQIGKYFDVPVTVYLSRYVPN